MQNIKKGSNWWTDVFVVKMSPTLHTSVQFWVLSSMSTMSTLPIIVKQRSPGTGLFTHWQGTWAGIRSSRDFPQHLGVIVLEFTTSQSSYTRHSKPVNQNWWVLSDERWNIFKNFKQVRVSTAPYGPNHDLSVNLTIQWFAVVLENAFTF